MEKTTEISQLFIWEKMKDNGWEKHGSMPPVSFSRFLYHVKGWSILGWVLVHLQAI